MLAGAEVTAITRKQPGALCGSVAIGGCALAKLLHFTPHMNTDLTVIEAIEQRRAIRLYDPTHRLSDAETRQRLELAMKSPTAFNIQHWRFVLVSDPELRQQIRAVAWDQA
jgi:hypothetical protein